MASAAVQVKREVARERTAPHLKAAFVARGFVWLWLVGFATFPILYLLIVSFTRQPDLLAGNFPPPTLTLLNWPRAFQSVPIIEYLQNSLTAAGVGAVITVVIAVPAAYAMARFKLWGGRLLSIVVSTYIAPPVLAVFPLFYMFRAAGLTNSEVGLAVVYGLANVPVAVWLLEGFVRRVPIEIEEAALVDGASSYQLLWKVVFRLMAPGIVAAAIICFILSYNELLVAQFFTTSTASQTLPVGISLFQGDRQVQFGQMAAASLTGLIPVYMAAVFLQRWLVEGLEQGALK